MSLLKRLANILTVICLTVILLATPCYADSKIVQITRGLQSTFVLYEDGSISSCGGNYLGRLGDGTTTTRCVLGPVLVNNACKVQAGDGGMALKKDGTVWTWGENDCGFRGYVTYDYLTPGPIPNMTGVKDIASSLNSCFAIKNDGTVWACGFNYNGSLGIGEHGGLTDFRTTPVQIKGLPNNIVSISASLVNGFALDDQGHVWAWGRNDVGQLGDGTTEERTTPVKLSIDHVKAISAGGYTTMAIKDDGTLWGWGANSDDFSGRLGGATSDRYSAIPLRVPGMTNVVSIITGDNSIALKSDGTVWAWGLDQSILGNGQSTQLSITSPTKVNVQDVIAITRNDGNIIVQKRDGSLWGWGQNQDGELGIGVFNDGLHFGEGVYTPTKMLPVGAMPLPDLRGTPKPIVMADGGINHYYDNNTSTPTPNAIVTSVTTASPTIMPTSILSNNSATPKTTVSSTLVPLPCPTPKQTPGMDFNSAALLGCLLIISGTISYLVKRKPR